MEAYYTKVAIVAFLLTTAIVSGPAQVVGQLTTICGISFDKLMLCKPAVTVKNPPPPIAACCMALSSADMQCLCKYKNSNVLRSLGIDPTQAMQLPVKCKLSKAIPCV